MLKPRARRHSPTYLTPKLYQPLPCPSSAFDHVTGLGLSISRPSSVNIPSAGSSPRSAMGAQPPTLTEILLDISSPPWTLTAFMAYLSQNHCMETLEFTLDSQRYAAFYNRLFAKDPTSAEAKDRVCESWEKIMQAYIVPCAPREVNIPARVRDRLLSLPTRPSPPHPSELDEAGRIIYELMNDSLLVPFIESVTPLHLEIPHDDQVRTSFSISSANRSAGPRLRSTGSLQAFDSEGLTDDSDDMSPPGTEPMTPPTTPPTSEWGFGASPGGFHRAMAAHNRSWKKVGEKLGFGRRSGSRRSTPTSTSNTECHNSPDLPHSHLA